MSYNGDVVLHCESYESIILTANRVGNEGTLMAVTSQHLIGILARQSTV